MTTIDNEIDFGVSEQQLWFLWRLGERSRDQLEAALDNGGELFKQVRKEVEESGVHTYPAGPWHAGLEPFPRAGRGARLGSAPGWAQPPAGAAVRDRASPERPTLTRPS